MAYETQQIDMLFLELSQFTKAKTKREIELEKQVEELETANVPAVAAIQFALETDEPMTFLRYWNEGEFDVLRDNWEGIPDEVFIGADPLFKKK